MQPLLLLFCFYPFSGFLSWGNLSIRKCDLIDNLMDREALRRVTFFKEKRMQTFKLFISVVLYGVLSSSVCKHGEKFC